MIYKDTKNWPRLDGQLVWGSEGVSWLEGGGERWTHEIYKIFLPYVLCPVNVLVIILFNYHIF